MSELKENSEAEVGSPQQAEKNVIAFEKRCIYCGKENDSINYICDCQDQKWFNEYRVLDLKPVFTSKHHQTILQSFREYSFDHPEGIAQYRALPFRDQYPKKLDPVGLTPLFNLKGLSRYHNTQVYIKNEGYNPSGCFKDRETLLALLNTRRRNLRHAVIYSSGNAAASAAIFAQRINLQLITFVAGDTYPEKIDFIQEHGSDVVVVGDESTNFETGFRLFADINAQGIFSDSKFDNWSVRNPYRVQGDKTTAIEILKQLSSKPLVAEVPDMVIVPTANGSCLAGIWKGFRELRQLNIISKLPKMVSVGIMNASPVFKAVKKEQTMTPERCDLSKMDPEDAAIGSTILAEEGYDSIEAAKAVLESGGYALEVNNREIKKALKRFLQMEGVLALKHAILPEPASLTSLAAIEKVKDHTPLSPKEKVVAIISGHGLKAREMLDQLLPDSPELHGLVESIIAKKQENIAATSRKRGRRKNVSANFEAVVQAFHELKK